MIDWMAVSNQIASRQPPLKGSQRPLASLGMALTNHRLAGASRGPHLIGQSLHLFSPREANFGWPPLATVSAIYCFTITSRGALFHSL